MACWLNKFFKIGKISVGSLSRLFLRPPPGARILPSGTGVPISPLVLISSSLQPFEIVSREMPVARETMLIPPSPRLIASAVAIKRLFSSSRKGFNNLYFSEIICSSRVVMYIDGHNLYKKMHNLFCYSYLAHRVSTLQSLSRDCSLEVAGNEKLWLLPLKICY